MSSYEATFWIILVAGLVVMGVAWWATRQLVRWKHQREDYHQAVLRNLHEQGHPHTHLWKNAGFIDGHPIETCWICDVEKLYAEAEDDGD